MPLNEACYLASSDKIYGVMENYVFMFNASTGRVESSTKVCAPCYGPMRIKEGTGVIYVASKSDFSVNRLTPNPPDTITNRQIWNVDPGTLAVTNYFQLDQYWQNILVTFADDLDYDYFAWGPTCMEISGGWMYFMYSSGYGYQHAAVLLTDPTDNFFNYTMGTTGASMSPQLFDINGLDWYRPYTGANDMRWYKLVYPFAFQPWSYQAAWDSTPDYITAIRYVASQASVYGVAGTDTLHKWAANAGTHTTASLSAVYSGVQPFRLRLSPLDGKLYIPCQKEDVVIIWDPATDTGTYKDGFNSPIDVVFTGSKSWAVQTATIGLKEIV